MGVHVSHLWPAEVINYVSIANPFESVTGPDPEPIIGITRSRQVSEECKAETGGYYLDSKIPHSTKDPRP